jgi:hypothetical protein
VTDQEFYKLREEYDAIALRAPPEERLSECRKFLDEHPDYLRECRRRETE